MTQEKKDSTTPKLRLSRDRKEREAAKSDQPEVVEATQASSKPKPDLRLKQESEIPPALPTQPDPLPTSDPAQQQPQAVEQIPDETKHRSLLTSMIVILILFAVLAGSGYGLYYVLQSPPEAADAPPSESVPPAAGTEATEATEATDQSTNALTRPIEKAKAVISAIPEIELPESDADVLPPSDPSAQELSQAAPATEAEPQPETTTPPVDSIRTQLVSEFLQNAHIGGVRAGENPRLILNGTSYEQGDLVDPQNGLRFIGLREKRLAFQDAQGIVYLKSF